MAIDRKQNLIGHWKQKYFWAELDAETEAKIDKLVKVMNEYDFKYQDRDEERRLYKKSLELRKRLGIHTPDIEGAIEREGK